MSVDISTEDNIIFDRIVKFRENFRKFDVYQEKNDKFEKLVFDVKNAKVTDFISNAIKTHKTNVSSLVSIGPKKGNNVILLNNLLKIENKVKEYVWKKISNKLIFKPQILNDHPFSFAFKIKFPISKCNDGSSYNFPIYDKEKNKTFGFLLEKDSVIDFKVQLREVWIGSKEFGCNWIVKEVTIVSSDAQNVKTQMFPHEKNKDDIPQWVINLLMTKMSDSSPQTDTKIIEKKVYTSIPSYPSPEIKHHTSSLNHQGGNGSKKTNSYDSQPAPKIGFIPNLIDIKNAKNKLRKRKDNKD